MKTSAAPATEASARPFVGRAKEIEELNAALGDAAAGHGSLVLVTGEAGIGKTRLMQVLSSAAGEQGWRVLVGRCWEEGGAPAYWPWIQVVRDAGGELERLAEPPAGAKTPGDPETVRFQLFDRATRFLLESARDQPTLIALDDLHAADAPSLLLLRFLGEAVTQTRILVVGSYRSGDSRVRELGELFAGLLRVGRRLTLRGLTTDDVEVYMAHVGGVAASRTVATRLHSITGGNPFFLGELVRTYAVGDVLHDSPEAARDPIRRVPEEVRVLIRRRVAGLSREAVAALQVAAVIGREFELRIIEKAGSLTVGRLLDVLSEAVDARVLVGGPPGDRYSFVHELVRETLYEDLPGDRRLELHLRIGRVLEELGRGDPDARLSEVAHHLALAAPLGDVDEAVDYLTRAGDRARDLLAYEEAASHYRRALGLLRTSGNGSPSRRCELLLRLGDAQWRAGDTRAASASFEEAAQLARTLGEAELLARAALGYVTGLGGFLLFARFAAGATGIGFLEEARAALPEEDSPLRARVLARLAVEMYSSNEVERRVALSREAIEMARRLGDAEALATALHARHWALCAPEMVGDRLANAEQMLDVAAVTGNQETAFLAHNNRFHALLELCDGAGMDAEIEAMTDLAERMLQPFYRWHTLCLRTVRATIQGRFDDALRLADRARGVRGLEHSRYADYVFHFAQSIAIRWAQGRFVELRDSVAGHGERFPWVPRWRDALSAAEAGDVRAARAEIERHARRDFTDLPRDGLWTLHLCALGQACILVGDRRRAEQLYELLLPTADRNTVSYTQQSLGPVALRLGMLATMLERWDDAERHYELALQRCALLGARPVRARVLREYSAMLTTRGLPADTPRADALLDEAARLSDELGLAGGSEHAAAGGDARAVFRREGEFWTIGYSGAAFRLRDVNGLRYLAILLGSSGTDVHVLELTQAADGARALPDASAQPVLDQQAKEEYRRRLHALGEELDEAREWSDLERIANAEEEIDALTDQLAAAAGLGGRDRELPSPAERARVTVTKAIRSAIKAIERHDAELGAHLAASVHTGRFCSYAPPGEAPPSWAL